MADKGSAEYKGTRDEGKNPTPSSPGTPTKPGLQGGAHEYGGVSPERRQRYPGPGGKMSVMLAQRLAQQLGLPEGVAPEDVLPVFVVAQLDEEPLNMDESLQGPLYRVVVVDTTVAQNLTRVVEEGVAIKSVTWVQNASGLAVPTLPQVAFGGQQPIPLPGLGFALEVTPPERRGLMVTSVAQAGTALTLLVSFGRSMVRVA